MELVFSNATLWTEGNLCHIGQPAILYTAETLKRWKKHKYVVAVNGVDTVRWATGKTFAAAIRAATGPCRTQRRTHALNEAHAH